MQNPRRVLLAAVVFGTLTGGCGDASPASEDRAAVDSLAPPSRSAAGVLAGAGDVGNREPPACVRGGTPREDVRRILGEPDSISFGAWLYGSSEIQFGYGVVVQTRDPDGRLHLCN